MRSSISAIARIMHEGNEVQVQTDYLKSTSFYTYIIDFIDINHNMLPPSCNMRVSTPSMRYHGMQPE